MREEHRWTVALEEHDAALRECLSVCDRIPTARWHEAPAPGRWSPSDVVLHLCQAYELGRDACAGGPGMRLRVSPRRAWGLRTLLLPVILLTRRFPRGVPAPAEVRPDAETSRQSTREVALARLAQVAQQAAGALRLLGDSRPVPRVTHAYFGPLTPRAVLRVLSAHTTHHARALARSTSVADTD